MAGEIGTIEWFFSEGSLALYLGMSTLDNKFGEIPGNQDSQAREHSGESSDDDRRGSASKVRAGERKDMTRRNAAREKKHNQAIRALGRHLGSDYLQDAQTRTGV